jgi:phytoene dehydrogenase-like protein/acyl-CoA thioesterase FadM
VLATIGTEQTGFSTPHFAATFVLGEERLAPVEEIMLPEQPLDIDPKEDLYNGKLLFQGPRFQRLVKIHAVDSTHCIFQTTRKASTEGNDRQLTGEAGTSWLIGDPYFRDSLLHAVQLSVSQHICLPLQIESIERFSGGGPADELLTGIVRIEDRSDREVHAEVTVVNDKGRIVERLTGYVLKILEYHADYPLPEELADPGPRDEMIIRRKLIACCKELGLKPPHIAVAYLANLQQMTKSERHEKELPLLKRAVGQLGNYNDDVSISWHESGKPCLAETSGENDISLSHDQGTVLCVAGENPQGCDIQSLPVHTEEEWLALLGKRRKPILDALVAEGDSINQAGTRIWAACEAVFKQTGQKNQDIMISSRIGDNVVFQTEETDARHTLLTIPLSLTRKPERMLAVTAFEEKKPDEQSCQELSSYHAERLNFDLDAYKAEICTGPFGQPMFHFYFPMTFRESANPSRTLYFSQYFDWIGKLREYMVQPIYEGLVESYTSGRWGTVTNGAEVDIFGDARSGDTIQGSVWLENISGKEQATLDFGFAWRKVLDKEHHELIAVGKVSTTWVEVLGHGIVEVQPLPKYAEDYFKKLLPNPQVKGIPQNTSQPEIAAGVGEELHREPEGPVRNAALLREEIFQSSLENANLVGNIYYSNYYKWQGVTRDNFLNAILPEYFDNSGDRGELRCVHCKVNHLNEAMPFDRILVRMYKKAVYERAVWLYTDYYRLDQDGKRHKLGYGEHKAVWYAPTQEGRWLPAKLPKALLRALLPEKVAQVKAYNRYPLSNKDAAYEVIIIGAGIGGLTAGALLAKRGKRVLVLDQHSKPGGFCTSWERQVNHNGKNLRYVFDAGVHDILGLGGHGHIRKLLRDLGVENKIEWRRVDHQYIVDDLHISVPRGLDGYIALLCEQFPEEHEGIATLFNEMHKIYASLYSQSLAEEHRSKWVDRPFLAMLDEFIKDRRLKEIISILSCYITDDKSKIKTLTIAPLFGEYFEGGYYPVGGPQVFSNTLAQALKDAGGTLACNTSVSRILVEKDAVSGVELGDGEKLYAPMVISNADLIQTFSRLIEPGYWPPYFAERLKELRPSNSAFLINLGLDFVPDVAPTTLMCMNNTILAIMTPSRIDPRLAPEGHSSMTLVTLIPNEEAATWRREEKGYAARKKKKGDALIAQAEQVIPGLSAHIVYRQDASPATFARYAWSTNGAIYATLIDGWKPSPKTPVQGLYLTGSSISARPGIGDAVYSGMLTCDVLLRHDIRN